jgi:hypothetical protein
MRCGGVVRGAAYERLILAGMTLHCTSRSNPVLGEGIRIVSVMRLQDRAAQDASLLCDLITSYRSFRHRFLSFLKYRDAQLRTACGRRDDVCWKPAHSIGHTASWPAEPRLAMLSRTQPSCAKSWI